MITKESPAVALDRGYFMCDECYNPRLRILVPVGPESKFSSTFRFSTNNVVDLPNPDPPSV